MSERTLWHIITSEHPPQQGGVSDYTHAVAHALVAVGDEVHVWCPSTDDAPDAHSGVTRGGVIVHRELGGLGRADLARVDRLLDRFPPPRRLLLQWVPHGFGFNAMNLWICLWLRARARRSRDHVEIVVHEPFLPITGGSWRQSVVALVQRAMTAMLLGSARRVLVTVPEWGRHWRPYAMGRRIPFRVAPVPSTVPVVHDTARVNELRARYAGAAPLVGHFGTHGRDGTALLGRTLAAILDARRDVHLLLIGRGSHELRRSLVNTDPTRAARVHATGTIASAELSLHLGACDVMVQPFPSGVNGRHTSVMASLAHGRPVVTTTGPLTEPYWLESDAVRVAGIGDTDAAARLTLALLSQPAERERLGRAARALYDARFDVTHVVTALRASE